MIAAVLFDLYETLVTERDVAVPRASKLGETLGLDDKAFRAAWKLQRPRIVNIGDHDVEELIGAQRAGLRAARVDWFVKPVADHPAFATVPCISKPHDLLELVSAA